MLTTRQERLFRYFDAAEYGLCLRLNRGCSQPQVREFFAAVSRLGDGRFWYGLMALLPAVYGREGLVAATRMAVVGLLGVALYKILKHHLVRERPYVSLIGVVAGSPPLDRYSFPSGHTLHAVSFTVLACTSFPELAWLLVPFTVLVGVSRPVLGLHYPTDVAAGAVLGATLAIAAIQIAPL